MRSIFLLTTLATAVSLAAPAFVAAQDAERIALEISEETTFFTEPVNEDGTIDYVAALNAHYGEGVSNEDNAFVLLVQLYPEESDPFRFEHWDDLFDELGIERDPDMPRMVDWFEYAEAQGIDVQQAEDIFYAAFTESWAQEQYPRLSAWLEINQPVIEILKEALSRPQYFCPFLSDNRGVFDASSLLRYHLHDRRIARMLVIHTFLMIQLGGLDSAIEDISLLYQFGSALSLDHTIMGKLVATSVWNMAESAVVHIAAGGELTHRQAITWLANREDSESLVPIADTFNFHLRCELLDLILRSHLEHDPNGWGAYFEFDRGLDEEVARNLGDDVASLCRRPEFDIDRSLRNINAIFDEAVAHAHLLPMADRKAAFAEFVQAIEDSIKQEDKVALIDLALRPNLSPSEKGWTDAQYTDLVTAYYFDIVTPPMDVGQRTQDRANTRRLVESTAIALLGYRDVHGELPETLDALVPVYFEAVPIDPYSELPLVYRVDDDGSAVVYSIGGNFVDDEGVDDYRDGDIAIRIGVPPEASD